MKPGANVDEEARLDVRARAFWRDGQRAFFHVMVFDPFAPTHTQTTLQKAFNNCEREKKRQYNQRVILLEHGTFTPLIFTPYGGAGREADNFMILANKLSSKQSTIKTINPS